MCNPWLQTENVYYAVKIVPFVDNGRPVENEQAESHRKPSILDLPGQGLLPCALIGTAKVPAPKQLLGGYQYGRVYAAGVTPRGGHRLLCQYRMHSGEIKKVLGWH